MGLVLGVHGPAKAGKDTMADYLIREFEWDAKFAFAGNLKEMCKEAFYLSDFDVYDQEGKKAYFRHPEKLDVYHMACILDWMEETHSEVKDKFHKVKHLLGEPLLTPRHVLQFVGTDICRVLASTYHVDVLIGKILANPDSRLIITDVRFPNEGDLILDRFNGMVVKLKKPPKEDTDNTDNVDRQHLSETAMDNWGRFTDVIENERKGVNFLYEEVNQFLEKHNLCQDMVETTVT